MIRARRQTEDLHNPVMGDQDIEPVQEEFDEIVLCCLADTDKRLLGKGARGIEKFVLGSTKWSDDITVTHNVSHSRDGGLEGSDRSRRDEGLIEAGHGIHSRALHYRL